MVFQIPGLTKTKRPNKPHMSVSVHSYTENSQLDVVACVREYMSRTAPFISAVKSRGIPMLTNMYLMVYEQYKFHLPIVCDM